MSNEPRKNKSKEEIASELKLIGETKRKRARVKTELYPLLKEVSTSIDNAKIFCMAGSMAIEQAFNNLQREMKVKDLKIVDFIKSDGKEAEHFKRLMDMFAEETLTDALSMIRDMPHAIDSFIREEMTKRPLTSLKEDLLD